MSDNLRKQEKKYLIHCKIYKLIKVKKAHLINKRGQKGPRIKQKRPKNFLPVITFLFYQFTYLIFNESNNCFLHSDILHFWQNLFLSIGHT